MPGCTLAPTGVLKPNASVEVTLMMGVAPVVVVVVAVSEVPPVAMPVVTPVEVAAAEVDAPVTGVEPEAVMTSVVVGRSAGVCPGAGGVVVRIRRARGNGEHDTYQQ